MHIYIPDFWCGVVVGIIGTLAVLLLAALLSSRDKDDNTAMPGKKQPAKEPPSQLPSKPPGRGHVELIEKIRTFEPMTDPPSKPASKGGVNPPIEHVPPPPNGGHLRKDAEDAHTCPQQRPGGGCGCGDPAKHTGPDPRKTAGGRDW